MRHVPSSMPWPNGGSVELSISPEEATYVTIATALPEAPIHELQAGVRGELLRPAGDGYDAALFTVVVGYYIWAAYV